MKFIQLSFFYCIISLSFVQFTFAQKWEKITVEEANYSISFPTTPTRNTDQVETELGVLDLNMLIVDGSAIDDENFVYLVNTTAYPGDFINSNNEETVEDFFIGTIEGASTNVDGELISTEILTYKGYPGRKIAVLYAMEDGDQAIITMHIYLVNNVSYMLQTISPVDNADNKSAKKFVKSFKLLD